MTTKTEPSRAPSNQAPAILETMASHFEMAPAEFKSALVETVIPNANDAQVAAFLLVAKKYDLDPFTKQIYAFPTKNGGIQPIVSVDGWAAIVNAHPQFDGMTFRDEIDEKGNLVSITCRIYRKDRKHPTEATEYMEECRRNTVPWQKWPRRMLRHKAMIQAARYAFGLSGIADPDEGERIMKDGIDPNDLSGEATIIEPAQNLDDVASKLASRNAEQAETPKPSAPPAEEAKDAAPAESEGEGEEKPKPTIHERCEMLVVELAEICGDHKFPYNRAKETLSYFGADAINDLSPKQAMGFQNKFDGLISYVKRMQKNEKDGALPMKQVSDVHARLSWWVNKLGADGVDFFAEYAHGEQKELLSDKSAVGIAEIDCTLAMVASKHPELAERFKEERSESSE